MRKGIEINDNGNVPKNITFQLSEIENLTSGLVTVSIEKATIEKISILLSQLYFLYYNRLFYIITDDAFKPKYQLIKLSIT